MDALEAATPQKLFFELFGDTSASVICDEPASNFIATYRVLNKATIAAASEAEDMLSKEDTQVSESRECRNDTHGITRFYIAQGDVINIHRRRKDSSTHNSATSSGMEESWD